MFDLSSPSGSQHVLLPSSPPDAPIRDQQLSTRTKNETQWTFESPERYNTRHSPITPAVRRYLDFGRVGSFNQQDCQLLSPLNSPEREHRPEQSWLSYHTLEKTPDLLLWRSPASQVPLGHDDTLQSHSPLHPASGSTLHAEKENARPPLFHSITLTRLMRRHNQFTTSPAQLMLPSSADRLEPTRLLCNSSRSYSFASRSSSIASLGAGTLTTGCMRLETSKQDCSPYRRPCRRRIRVHETSLSIARMNCNALAAPADRTRPRAILRHSALFARSQICETRPVARRSPKAATRMMLRMKLDPDWCV